MTSTDPNAIREHGTDIDVLLPKNSIRRRCESEFEVLTPKSMRWQLFADAPDLALQWADPAAASSRAAHKTRL